MVTNEIRTKIVEAITENRNIYESDSKHATALGINKAAYSRIKNGDIENVLADASWISIARRLNVNLRNEQPWRAVSTPVFEYITIQLEACQNSGISALLCDIPNIGKTFTAKIYVKNHKNAIYVDCSQVKTKQKLIRYIAKEFGISSTGKYSDVYEDLVYYLKTLGNPLVILDEAGDLEYAAFLELKALWNATERCCGWYMMGADGLKKKIERSIDCKRVGYAEMLSRYGDGYKRITPENEKDCREFLQSQAAMIVKANAPEGSDIRGLVVASAGSLRRVYIEIEKIKRVG